MLRTEEFVAIGAGVLSVALAVLSFLAITLGGLIAASP